MTPNLLFNHIFSLKSLDFLMEANTMSWLNPDVHLVCNKGYLRIFKQMREQMTNVVTGRENG